MRHEYKIYRELEKRSATGDVPEGFCRAYKLDVTSKHSYLVIDLLGSSLSDLFRNKCAKKFSLKTGNDCDSSASKLSRTQCAHFCINCLCHKCYK